MTVAHGNQGLIGYQNLLRGLTPTTEDAQVSFPVEQMFDGRSSTQAGFAVGDGEVIFDLGSAMSVDYVAMAKHNLGSESATLNIEYSTTGTSGPWTAFLSQSPSSDAPVLWRVGAVSARYWRIAFSGHAATLFIADLSLGAQLLLPAGMPVEWLSPFYAPQGRMVANRTRRGDLVGLSHEPEPAQCSIELNLVSPGWFDSNWSALYTSITAYPFYFVHDVDNRPSEVFFCWLRDRLPTAPYSTAGLFQGVTLEVEGITA